MKELGFIIQGLPQLDPVQIIDASAGYEGGENISIHFKSCRKRGELQIPSVR